MKHKIIVTGGLGFIGSHTVVCLHEAGFEPIIIDNLSNSEASAMDGIEKLIGYKPIWANINVNDKSTEIPIGVSCRTCDRLDCSQRAFPPLHKKFDVDINTRGVSVYVGDKND